MKKLILALSLLLCATTSLFSAQPIVQGVVAQQPALQQHIPATGPIQLGDTAIQQGIIMDIIVNDENFAEEKNTIDTFSQNVQNPTYQNIVTLINNSTACMQDGLKVLEAFERAIMYYIHKQNYILTIEDKWLNIFVTGIRWSWITPAEWMPRYWYSSNNSLMVKQCMTELSTLARITKKYSTISSARMNLKVESYLNWKRNALIISTAYLVANLALRRDLSKSPLKILMNNGLMGSPKIISQVIDDTVDFTTTVCKPVAYVANFCLKGMNISDPAKPSNQEGNVSGLVTTSNQSSVSNEITTQLPETSNPKTAKPKKNKESYYAQYVRPHNKTMRDYISGFFNENSNELIQKQTKLQDDVNNHVLKAIKERHHNQEKSFSGADLEKLNNKDQKNKNISTYLSGFFKRNSNDSVNPLEINERLKKVSDDLESAKKAEKKQQQLYNIATLTSSNETAQKELKELQKAQQKTKELTDHHDKLATLDPSIF